MSAPNPGQKWNIPDVMKQLGTLETLIGDHEAKPGVPATSTMSLHLYRLAAKQSDNQTPHSQEELYYILLGSRTLSLYYGTANEKRVQADVGDIIYVPANVPHRFEGSDELITLVFSHLLSPDSCYEVGSLATCPQRYSSIRSRLLTR